SRSWRRQTRTAESERVLDPGEDLEPLRTHPRVDEADDLRADDTAEAESADPVEVRHGRRGDVVEHLARLDERRDLELGVHAEEVSVPHPRPDLGLRDRAVEVDEAVRSVPAQGPPSADAAHLPERRVV